MSDHTLISSDRGTGRVAAPKKSGFYYNWGPQAWIDMWMSNTMLVKKAMPIVSHTFVPILRLSGDKAQVDRDYEADQVAPRSHRYFRLAARKMAQALRQFCARGGVGAAGAAQALQPEAV